MVERDESGRDGVDVIVVADMLFASRVRGVAAAVGATVRVVGRPDRLAAAVADTGARLVIVDLEMAGGGGPDAIREIRSGSAADGPRVVAFSSHTNTAAIEAGRAAGADRVMARSAFVAALPDLLAGQP